MKESIALDTNILIYFFDEYEEQKHNKSLELLQKINNNEVDIVLSIQNITEFYQWVLKRKKISIQAARIIINDLSCMENIKIYDLNMHTVMRAIELQTENNTPFWDTLLFANARLHGATTFITENTKDFKSNVIKVVNPFEA